MKENAKINALKKEIKHIEQLISEEYWEGVLDLAGDVIAQLEKLAKLPKQSGQFKEKNPDICDMLQKVKLHVCGMVGF